MTEDEVLDLLWTALPDTQAASLYPSRPNLRRPELYVTVRGECWRISAELHPHGSESP